MLSLRLNNQVLIDCAAISVTLAERQAPVACLRPSQQQDWSKLLQQAKRQESRVEIAPGTTIEARLLGSQSIGPGGTAEAVAVCLKEDLENTLLDRPPDNQAGWLIYQRTATEEAWNFLNRTCGNRLESVANNTQQWNDHIAPRGCLVRHGSWSNLEYLERLVQWLSERTGGAMGWSVYTDQQNPVRLLDYSQARKVEWEVGSGGVPHPLSRSGGNRDNLCLTRQFQLNDANQAGAFYKTLVSRGFPGTVDKDFNGTVDTPDQLIVCPCAVEVLGATYRCARVTYEWSEDTNNPDQWPNTIRATAFLTPWECGDQPIPSTSFPGLLLDGQFQQWDGNAADLVQVSPAENAIPKWLLAMDEHAGNTGHLAAHVALPGAQDEPYAGLYVRYEQGRAFKMLLIPGQAPLVLGGHQRFAEELEKASIVINAERIALTTSPATNSLTVSEGQISLISTSEVLAQVQSDGDIQNSLKLAAELLQTEENLKVGGQVDVGN